MLLGLFRIILYAIFAYFISKVFRFVLAKGKKTISTSGSPSKKLSGVMVKDEICQTYLPKEDAIREIKEGKKHFFCSKECQNKFHKFKK